MSYVYVIAPALPLTGYVKIGVSSRPDNRRRALQAASGTPLTVMFAMQCDDQSCLTAPSAHRVERIAHALLSAKRRHGEWFDVGSEEAVDAIMTARKIAAPLLQMPHIVRAGSVGNSLFANWPADRSDAQKDAERRYRKGRTAIFLRFTPEEYALLESASSGRVAGWIKDEVLSCAVTEEVVAEHCTQRVSGRP